MAGQPPRRRVGAAPAVPFYAGSGAPTQAEVHARVVQGTRAAVRALAASARPFTPADARRGLAASADWDQPQGLGATSALPRPSSALTFALIQFL